MATIRKTLTEIKAKPFIFSAGQRARLEAMTDEEIEANALSDPDNQPMTDEQLDRAVTARRIRQTREKMHLSQSQFAATYHIPIGTLRDWEQARRKPDAPALAYLCVIEKEPEAVARALS
jgi:putative transcriptional regulator